MTTTGTALRADGFAFTWDTTRDHATLHHAGHEVRSGPLLPLFWVQTPAGLRALEAAVTNRHEEAGEVRLELRLDDLGTGVLRVRLVPLSLPLNTGPRQVLAVIDGAETPHEDWRWAGGCMRLEVEATLRERALMGFIITTS